MNLINQKDKIFIAGSTGMVGSAILRHLNEKGYNNVLTNKKSSLNLLEFNAVEKWFEIKKPDVVIMQQQRLEEYLQIVIILQNF